MSFFLNNSCSTTQGGYLMYGISSVSLHNLSVEILNIFGIRFSRIAFCRRSLGLGLTADRTLRPTLFIDLGDWLVLVK